MSTKEKKRKIIDTTKIRVDIVLERKKKEVEKNKSEIKHLYALHLYALSLVENRSRPRIEGQVDHLCS